MEIVIRKSGILDLPKFITAKLGLTTGKKVTLSIKDNELMIKPVENVTAKITESIKLDDIKLIEEIVETEDWI